AMNYARTAIGTSRMYSDTWTVSIRTTKQTVKARPPMTNHNKPRTAGEWLALGDELGPELAKMFTPEPWEHSWASNPNHRRCSRCKGECNLIATPQFCSTPDPIDTKDWNVAMEWRDKVHAIRWDDAMYVIYRAASHASVWRYSDWLRRHAQPKHFLIAAAMAAGRSKE
ncbi:hypothetical protein LCGC14_2437650, partial [marine sediment metagenome]